MKLSHPYFENPIIFEENKINVLIIENQRFFSRFIIELIQQLNGYDGGFVLSSNYNPLEINKNIDILIDPFTLEFNQKKIINKLYSQLKDYALDGNYYIDLKVLQSEIFQYIESLTNAIQYPIIYACDIDVTSIFKMVEIKLDSSYETLVEKLMDYCSIIQEFCNISCLVILNLKCYLSDLELEQFYSFISYKKMDILLIENTVREKRFNNEILHIIDSDLCEIC